MYAAIMTGLGNHLRNHWGCYKDDKEPIRVNYGATDSFWNKFNLDRLELPGLIYASSSISWPKGLTGHLSQVRIGTNTTNTAEVVVSAVPIKVDLTLGMVGKDEEEHFWHISKYIELAAKKAEMEYRIILPEVNQQVNWLSSLSEFSELSPPPSGKEFSTYDPEGQYYPLEATFSMQTNMLISSEKKLIRAIYSGVSVGGSEVTRNIVTTVNPDDNIVVRTISEEDINETIKEKMTWEKMITKT